MSSTFARTINIKITDWKGKVCRNIKKRFTLNFYKLVIDKVVYTATNRSFVQEVVDQFTIYKVFLKKQTPFILVVFRELKHKDEGQVTNAVDKKLIYSHIIFVFRFFLQKLHPQEMKFQFLCH